MAQSERTENVTCGIKVRSLPSGSSERRGKGTDAEYIITDVMSRTRRGGPETWREDTLDVPFFR
jgi:hypothetical protein